MTIITYILEIILLISVITLLPSTIKDMIKEFKNN